MIQVGLLGASGRMGQWVSQLIQTEFSRSATLLAKSSRGESLAPLLQSDVVIDFSSPNALSELAKLALKQKNNIPVFIIGSTGWKLKDHAPFQKILEELSLVTPVLVSSNFSTGVFCVTEILKKFAPLLERCEYTPVITETHHQHKKDAPSGTAIALQQAIDPRNSQRIPTHSIRAGEVIGDHEILFYGKADQISITHHVQDRSIFARGAIEVALWLVTKKNESKAFHGLLGMDSYFKEKWNESHF